MAEVMVRLVYRLAAIHFEILLYVAAPCGLEDGHPGLPVALREDYQV